MRRTVYPMIDHLFDPVFVWRLAGPIVFWNQSAEQVYGYSKEEAIGKISHELLQTVFSDGLSAADIEAALERDGKWTGQLIHRAKSGATITVDTRMKVATLPSDVLPALGNTPSAQQKVVLEANRDMTHQRQIEEESARRSGQQACIAALGRIASERDDVEMLMGEAVRRILKEMGVEHVQILEYSSEARSFKLTTGTGWLTQALPPADLVGALESQLVFTITSGEPVIVPDTGGERRFSVSRRLLKAGVGACMTVLIRDHPHPYGVMGVYTRTPRSFSSDELIFLRGVANLLAGAVQHNRANRALRDRQARMAAVIDTALEGIITIDERGIIESVNPAACSLFGYEPAEVVGKNVKMLMPEPYHGEHDTYMMNYLRTGKARIIGIGREVYGLRKNGTVFPLHLGVSEFRVGGKRMFTGQVRDITDRRRLEREILEIGAQEQMRIGQDLHDGLCQELTGISFALEVLGKKLASRDAPETGSIRRVSELVDQSITHARSLAHGLQPVALDATGLETALQELAVKTEKLFHVSCLFVSEGIVLVHDNVVATHAYRIAQEAIGNAIKHGKAKTIVLDLSVRSESLAMTITDDGIGLGNAEGDGKGIGMQTMAYRARVVGGTLTVRPRDQGGTVVSCNIPLKQMNITSADTERASKDGSEIETTQDSDQEQVTHAAQGTGRNTPNRKRAGRAKAQGVSGGRSSNRPRAPR